MGLSKISGSGIDNNVIVPANLHSSFVLPISKLATDGGATFGNTITSGSSTVRGQFLGNCPSSITASSADAFIANYNGTTAARVRYDGSVTFAGGAFSIDGDGEITTNVKSAGHIELDSTGTFSTPKIKLFANTGAATFTGEVNIGGYSGGSTTTDGVLLGSVGGVYSQLAGSAAGSGVLWQGMHGSTFTSRITAAGSFIIKNDISLERATAPSNVKISGSDTHAVWLSDGKFALKYDGSASFKDGSSRFAGINGGSAVFYGGDSSTTSQSNAKFRLNTDGGGTFASGLISLAANGGVSLGSAGTANGVTLSLVAGTSPAASAYTLLQGYQSDGSTASFLFKASGDASFNGRVDIGTNSLDNYSIAAFSNSAVNGGVYAQNNNSSGKLFVGQSNSTEVIILKANGNASFKGELDLGNPGVSNAVINSADGLFINIDSNNNSTNDSFQIRHNGTGAGGGNLLFSVSETADASFAKTVSTPTIKAEYNLQTGHRSSSLGLFIGTTDHGNATPANSTASITGDGSASFSGNIDLTDSTVDLYSQTTNSNSKTFQLFSDIGGTKVEKASITADGGGTFAGNVQVGGNAGNNTRPVGTFLWSVGALSVAAVSGQNVWNGFTAGNNTNTSTITADGGATFAGVLQGNQRVVVNGAGGKSGTSNTFLNYAGDGTTVTASIDANGLGVFDGGLRVTHTANTRHCRLLYDGVYSTGQDLYLWTGTTNSILFGNNSSSKMMLQCSTGALLLNRSTRNNLGKFSMDFYGQSENGIVIKNTWNGNGAALVVFRSSGNHVAGVISQTAYNAVNYGSGSDYRLKENIIDMSDPIVRIKRLKPKRFNFISDIDKNEVDGFLAHEAAEVVPEAVTGEKDGKEMQCIDHGKLVPLLTGALKEAISSIEALEARISALES